MFLKICGLTNEADAAHAAAAGATALGVVFAPSSPRCVSADTARDIVEAVPARVPVVGVFVNAPLEEIVANDAHPGIRVVQLHGDEPEGYAAALKMPLLRAAGVDVRLDSWPTATLLLDATSAAQRGGTGQRVDWEKAAAVASQRKTVLAGGLTPANVADAIAAVRPFGVDVSSGVEASPGRKDRDKVSRFLENARNAYSKFVEANL
ncbi:MAG TPA: phosphoribosylanthranilate isomerase [Vicinamibacterales bacterium]|nr:phosphoribosylanthranilate isomerase [Vicinamibacterales bacterium]